MDPWVQQDRAGSVPLRTLIGELAGQEADFFATRKPVASPETTVAGPPAVETPATTQLRRTN
jgi:hypothetical protein